MFWSSVIVIGGGSGKLQVACGVPRMWWRATPLESPESFGRWPGTSGGPGIRDGRISRAQTTPSGRQYLLVEVEDLDPTSEITLRSDPTSGITFSMGLWQTLMMEEQGDSLATGDVIKGGGRNLFDWTEQAIQVFLWPKKSLLPTQYHEIRRITNSRFLPALLWTYFPFLSS